ncbi:hypothetical protein FB451DRAFT_1164842 [Mycena latifolia]|nr:hypothetical protein FB451DRAFT_1164842 [Mycena latifolia]
MCGMYRGRIALYESTGSSMMNSETTGSEVQNRRRVANGQDVPRPCRAVISMPGMDERRHGWDRVALKFTEEDLLGAALIDFVEAGVHERRVATAAVPIEWCDAGDEKKDSETGSEGSIPRRAGTITNGSMEEPRYIENGRASPVGRTTSASHWLDGGGTAPAPREHVNTASSTADAPFDSGTSLALPWSDFALFPALAHASVSVLR